MDPTWTTSVWALVMLLTFGCGAGVLTFYGLKIINAPKLPRDMSLVRDELELRCRRVINANMQLMESVRDLADIVDQLPPEYRPVAQQTLRLAQLMEEATYHEGAQAGVFPRPLFGAGVSPSEGPPGNGAAPASEGWEVVGGQIIRRN